MMFFNVQVGLSRSTQYPDIAWRYWRIDTFDGVPYYTWVAPLGTPLPFGYFKHSWQATISVREMECIMDGCIDVTS